MENDDIFEMLEKIKKTNMDSKINSNICIHSNISVIEMSDVCNDCGKVINMKNFVMEDSKFYVNDTKVDNRRCNSLPVKESNIFKHLDLIKGLPQDIRQMANTRYNMFFRKEVHRGDKLKGIIFAIVFNLYKENGVPILPADIYKYLKISKKTALAGKSDYMRLCGKSITTTCTNPTYFIEPIVKLFNGTKNDIEIILELYNKIKIKSSVINSSSPYSVFASLYYYIKSLEGEVDIEEFSKKINLSKITINNLYKNIKRIL